MSSSATPSIYFIGREAEGFRYQVCIHVTNEFFEVFELKYDATGYKYAQKFLDSRTLLIPWSNINNIEYAANQMIIIYAKLLNVYIRLSEPRREDSCPQLPHADVCQKINECANNRRVIFVKKYSDEIKEHDFTLDARVYVGRDLFRVCTDKTGIDVYYNSIQMIGHADGVTTCYCSDQAVRFKVLKESGISTTRSCLKEQYHYWLQRMWRGKKAG